MGHVLEFYALEWTTICSLIGSGDVRLIPELEKQIADVVYPPEGGLELWKAGLRELIVGPLGKRLHESLEGRRVAVVEAEAPVAEAFAGILRVSGTWLGSISHRSRLGCEFREEFLGSTVPRLLKTPYDLTVLWSRPLCGLASDAIPGWGGLSATELDSLVRDLPDDSSLEQVKPEHAEWCLALLELLSAAAGGDLVTVYC